MFQVLWEKLLTELETKKSDYFNRKLNTLKLKNYAEIGETNG